MVVFKKQWFLPKQIKFSLKFLQQEKYSEAKKFVNELADSNNGLLSWLNKLPKKLDQTKAAVLKTLHLRQCILNVNKVKVVVSFCNF